MDVEDLTQFEKKSICTGISLSAVICEIALLGICLAGDKLHYRYTDFILHNAWTRAILDNLSHGLIAFLTWAIFIDFSFHRWHVFQCALCAFMAMLLDIDHFMAAKTLNIEGALSLTNRPPFHATTLIPVVAFLIYWVSRNLVISDALGKFALIFTLAWLSHHIRDGARRGLWLWPMGSTPPLPYWLYITLTLALPLGFRFVALLYTRVYQDRTTSA